MALVSCFFLKKQDEMKKEKLWEIKTMQFTFWKKGQTQKTNSLPEAVLKHFEELLEAYNTGKEAYFRVLHAHLTAGGPMLFNARQIAYNKHLSAYDDLVTFYREHPELKKHNVVLPEFAKTNMADFN
jgi:hypothetical protein